MNVLSTNILALLKSTEPRVGGHRKGISMNPNLPGIQLSQNQSGGQLPDLVGLSEDEEEDEPQ